MTKSRSIVFGVITEIPQELDGGNYACGEILINPQADRHVVGANIVVDPPGDNSELFLAALQQREQSPGSSVVDLSKRQLLLCNTPVFRLGEILVIDPRNDRSIPDGRKPSKWDVGCEYFSDINKAVNRAKEVVG
jgi:hypothetical protein